MHSHIIIYYNIYVTKQSFVVLGRSETVFIYPKIILLKTKNEENVNKIKVDDQYKQVQSILNNFLEQNMINK